MLALCAAVLVLALASSVRADTPANCTYESILGTWTFHLGPHGQNRLYHALTCIQAYIHLHNSPFSNSTSHSTNCSENWQPVADYSVTLNFPDTVVDQDGNVGFFTLIYNQGFEVVVGGRKYFAFSYYEMDGQNVNSICNTTFPGWSHTIDGLDWACYVGEKTADTHTAQHTQTHTAAPALSEQVYARQQEYVDLINSSPRPWKAAVYPEYDVCVHTCKQCILSHVTLQAIMHAFSTDHAPI